MELKEAVKDFLSNILHEFSYHPFIAPYLGVDKENPPRHYIHQYEIVSRLALRRPIRVLIGDEIGLGKTITALMVSKYLERLNTVKRVLIIVPRVLVWQWRKELVRMGIPESRIKHIERSTIEFLRFQNFPEGFYIASMDLLKREERVNEIVHVPWDLIIVDEVHKFGYRTKRFWKLGKTLIQRMHNRNAIFLSATPHRGDPRDYIMRLQLLDPYLIEGWRALDRRTFYELTHGSILFRRTKEDVNRIYERKQIFPDAKFYACVVSAKESEAEFVKRLVGFLRSKLVEFAYEKGLISERIIPLLTVLIFKRASSSPYAAWTTLQRLLERRAAPEFTEELIDNVESFLGTEYYDIEYPEEDPEHVFNEFLDRTSPLLTERDRQEIIELRDLAKKIMVEGDSKLMALLSLLEDIMKDEQSKVIIFTEYKDTLHYLVENINKKHPEWSGKVLSLSSDETRDSKLFERIRRKFERDPQARILISTDVIAEGVNLQVAHILINYEIPWSLIKLEQRIGRVWRLGQKKEVEAYTLFMNNVADFAALNSMYRKLMNLKRAELYPRPVTGQEVMLYAEAEDLVKIHTAISVTKTAKKKKFKKVTEAKAILTYLRENSAGLERLVASILAAKQEIERELASKGVLYKPKSKEEIEKSMMLLGFRNPDQLFESFKNLVRASSEILGFKVVDEGDSLKVTMEYEMPRILSQIEDFYGLLHQKHTKPSMNELISYGEVEGTIALLPVEVRDKANDNLLYRELVGVNLEKGIIIRGAVLLKKVSEALHNCIGVAEGKPNHKDIPITILSEIIGNLRKSLVLLLGPISRYMTSLESSRLRDKDNVWLRPSRLNFKFGSLIGYIRFVKRPLTVPEEIPEKIRRESEKEAMRFVLEVERQEGRIPEVVAESEHYDIRSVNPATGEVRLIEVKGHKGSEVYGELTASEFKLAQEEGDRYWLYIVYQLGSENPKLLRFRNPTKTMNWTVIEKIEKRSRYVFWPKTA